VLSINMDGPTLLLFLREGLLVEFYLTIFELL